MTKPRFEDIATIGWIFDLEFHLPPFDNHTDECFFDIDTFRETDEFQDFIAMIGDLKIPYEYAWVGGQGKIYLVIKTEDIDGV